MNNPPNGKERPDVTFDVACDGRLISLTIVCQDQEHAAGAYQGMVAACERGAMRLTLIAGKGGMLIVERGHK